MRNGILLTLAPMIVVLVNLAWTPATASEPGPLVDVARLQNEYEQRGYSHIRNLLSLEQVWQAAQSHKSGLAVDFSHVSELNDGSRIDPKKIYGEAFAGPYPFEAKESDYAYKRFRKTAAIKAGEAVLAVGDFFKPAYNSEDWTQKGQVMLRYALFLEQAGPDQRLGVYDTRAVFHKVDGEYRKLPTIVEGPLLNMVHSNAPGQATITFITDEPVAAKILLDGSVVVSESQPTRDHNLKLHGLRPGVVHTYAVDIGAHRTRDFAFRAAPAPGTSGITLGYTGDSREGVGGGMETFMGVNHRVLEQIMASVYLRGTDVFLFGGDLVNGYTTSKPDFHAQLHAWKQAATGFWNHRPVYSALGNHESLVYHYDHKTDKGHTLMIDQWPYATASAEAVFAEALVQPQNGPKVNDASRPPYQENVYSVQYGDVLAIAFNNNYWYSSHPYLVGGSPEGYILQDQMDWIENELDRAEANPSIRYILLFAQEPVFPNGGHVQDAMWYNGDNSKRAHFFEDGELRPAKKGIIEMRNALVRAAAASSKVAAVLCSDEHAYHRTLINKKVPIGNVEIDDPNHDNQLGGAGETISPLRDLKHGTWYIVSGGAGAPFYAEQDTPWNVHWKTVTPKPRLIENYFYSSQENFLIFHSSEAGMSLQVFTPRGELLDSVEDLMAGKK